MKFSDHFGVVRTDEDDWFDPDVAVDTRLFLDPFLLLQEEEVVGSRWTGSHDRLIGHFAQCYTLIAKSIGPRSTSLQVAEKLLSFPEPVETCLGYTASGTSGLGSGATHARFMIDSIKTAIAAGLEAPEHIEEIGILNEGIGADRISDAACNVLKAELIQYTKDVCAQHGVPTESIVVRNSRCDLRSGRWFNERQDLPVNPVSGRAVILVPQRFLRALPSLNADDWFDSSLNMDLRTDLNVSVGSKVPKKTIVKYAKKHPERIRQWARELKDADTTVPYDFSADPLGLVQWQAAGADFAASHPIQSRVQTDDQLVEFIRSVLGQFKLFVEEQGGWKLLWNDNKTEKPEEAAQLALLGVARTYCRAHGVEMDREVNFGRGPVDFKLSAGPGVRLLVEAKKLHNGSFWNGLESQLPSYMKSDETKAGFLLAIQYRSDGVSKSRKQELSDRVAGLANDTGISIGYALVDARPKASASKMQESD